MLKFESSIVWSKKSMEISWKNMQQLPKAWCPFLSNTQEVTIQNNLDLFILDSNDQFQFEIVIGGGMNCYQNFICPFFSVEKKQTN